MEEARNDKSMTVIEHLDELRTRIIYMLIAFTCTSVGAWFVSLRGLKLIKDAAGKSNIKLQVLGPTDAFMMRLKLSAVLGIMLAFPIIIWQIWAFVAPGLKKNEKKYTFPVIIAGTVLFFTGGGFAMLIVPPALRFLERFGGGIVEFNYTLDKFISFVASFVLSFGVVFQFPIILFLLAKLGVVSYKALCASRRYAIVGAIAAGALITPDPVTNIIVTVPLYLLFEISLLVIRFTTAPAATE